MCRIIKFALLAVLLSAPAVAQDIGNMTTSDFKTDSLALPEAAAPKGDRRAGMAPALLASTLLGQTIYARDGKRIGTLSDVVMTEDLDSFLAIVGIGGFLGFGTRDVAIPKDRIAVSQDEAGELRLTIASTREQLQQAPVFDRTALMR